MLYVVIIYCDCYSFTLGTRGFCCAVSGSDVLYCDPLVFLAAPRVLLLWFYSDFSKMCCDEIEARVGLAFDVGSYLSVESKGLFTWREGDSGTRVTLPAGLNYSPPLHGRAIRAGYHIGELSFFGGLLFWRAHVLADYFYCNGAIY